MNEIETKLYEKYVVVLTVISQDRFLVKIAIFMQSNYKILFYFIYFFFFHKMKHFSLNIKSSSIVIIFKYTIDLFSHFGI